MVDPVDAPAADAAPLEDEDDRILVVMNGRSARIEPHVIGYAKIARMMKMRAPTITILLPNGSSSTLTLGQETDAVPGMVINAIDTGNG